MKLRCDLHLGQHASKLLLVPKPEEPFEHLALKLAAYAMFLPLSPVVEPSSNHPALMGSDIKPDVFTMDESGAISIWIECGSVSLNKLDKATRRFPQARIVVLKATLQEAERLRKELREQVRHEGRIDIWTWKNNDFSIWRSALDEKTEIFGEAHEKSFNLVVNDVAYAVDLVSV